MNRTIRQMPLPGTPDPAPEAWEAEHGSLARRAAAEGIVLLKNEDGVLPLAPGSTVALYGAGAFSACMPPFALPNSGVGSIIN